MAFWDTENRVEDLVEEHLDHVEKVLKKFGEGMKAWVKHEDIEEAEDLADEIRDLEGRADDIRRDIEKVLIGGALLANSRGQIMDLVERIDKLANAGEAAMNFAVLQKITVPEELKPLIIKIVDETLEIINHVRQGMLELMEGDDDSAREETKKIEIGEGDVDDLEREFISELYSTELDLAEKLLLREYLEVLVEVSDRSEDFSDRLDTIIAIRKA